MSVRIVAAVPHNDTEELEVILEVTTGEEFNQKTELKQVWLDAHKLLELADA